MEGHKNGTICKYCGLSIKSGGITRLKFHLSHTDPHSNTKKCPNVPLKVKQEMKQLLEQKSKSKAKKAVDMEEIRAELRGTMEGKHHSLIDDDDEEEVDEDVYMYPADIVKPGKISFFSEKWQNGNFVEIVQAKTSKFSRSWMTKRTSLLESSREI